jgi:hypothetical protein
VLSLFLWNLRLIRTWNAEIWNRIVHNLWDIFMMLGAIERRGRGSARRGARRNRRRKLRTRRIARTPQSEFPLKRSITLTCAVFRSDMVDCWTCC